MKELRYKYVVPPISEYAARKMELKKHGIRYNEMAVFILIKDCILSQDGETRTNEDGLFVRVGHEDIREQLYLLEKKSDRVLTRMVDTLIDASLIKRLPDSGERFYGEGSRFQEYLWLEDVGNTTF
jgi:hypothetical protein